MKKGRWNGRDLQTHKTLIHTQPHTVHTEYEHTRIHIHTTNTLVSRKPRSYSDMDVAVTAITAKTNTIEMGGSKKIHNKT